MTRTGDWLRGTYSYPDGALMARRGMGFVGHTLTEMAHLWHAQGTGFVGRTLAEMAYLWHAGERAGWDSYRDGVPTARGGGRAGLNDIVYLRHARGLTDGFGMTLDSGHLPITSYLGSLMSVNPHPIPITAIIPTFNEAKDIEAAIESVRWCDEVLVVDSYSSDDTVTLAKAIGAKVLQHQFEGFAPQKNWAMGQASHDIILLLDADERVSEALREEIQGLLQSDSLGADGYWIRRKNRFMGRELRYIWKNDKVMRLVHRQYCHYPPVDVHEEMECSGRVAELQHHLLHDTYTNKGVIAHFEKSERYTTLAALERWKKTGRVSMFHLALKPAFTFFKQYILKLGILDGRAGYVISCSAAWNVFQRYLKIWRMQEGESIELPPR